MEAAFDMVDLLREDNEGAVTSKESCPWADLHHRRPLTRQWAIDPSEVWVRLLGKFALFSITSLVNNDSTRSERNSAPIDAVDEITSLSFCGEVASLVGPPPYGNVMHMCTQHESALRILPDYG